jgi:ABC-type transporter Mla maintaining outer membrane lipid asymmetry ATPase subunit MlaF
VETTPVNPAQDIQFHYFGPLEGREIVLPQSGRIVVFVGTNGSGKSRTLENVYNQFVNEHVRAARVVASQFALGVQGDANGESQLEMQAAVFETHPSGLAAISKLARNAALRIQVQTTLEHLLGRSLTIRTDQGLTRFAFSNARGHEYTPSREATGIQGLVTLLTYIYDPDVEVLLLDEPEANLHPPHQAFVLQELIRSGKRAFIATHSPFFLPIQREENLCGVLCFHAAKYPTTFAADEYVKRELKKLLPQFNAERRGLFFADEPVFVEGNSYEAIITTLLRRSGRDLQAAGATLLRNSREMGHRFHHKRATNFTANGPLISRETGHPQQHRKTPMAA